MSPLISRRFEAYLIGNGEEPNNNGPNGSSGERQFECEAVSYLVSISKRITDNPVV
jgi:hypothetical protein